MARKQVRKHFGDDVVERELRAVGGSVDAFVIDISGAAPAIMFRDKNGHLRDIFVSDDDLYEEMLSYLRRRNAPELDA